MAESNRDSELSKDGGSSTDEELSVGGASPKLYDADESQTTSDHAQSSLANGDIKFSIDNILDPNFGKVPITPQQILDLLPKNPIYNKQSLVNKSQICEDKIKLWRPGIDSDEARTSSTDEITDTDQSDTSRKSQKWPAWVYCTRYSDRPSSGIHIFFFYCQFDVKVVADRWVCCSCV